MSLMSQNRINFRQRPHEPVKALNENFAFFTASVTDSPNFMRVRLRFEFYENMFGNERNTSKILAFERLEIKLTYLMFVLCIVPRLILEPFRSRLEGQF